MIADRNHQPAAKARAQCAGCDWSVVVDEKKAAPAQGFVGKFFAEQHCAKAKSDVGAQAKLMCETIATNGGYRNPKWTVADSPCDCQRPNDKVMNCLADLAYSCRWEMKVTERTEICG